MPNMRFLLTVRKSDGLCLPYTQSPPALSPLDYSHILLHAQLMHNTFKADTALTEHQLDLIRSCYNQVKDLPLHIELLEKAVTLIEKQDNRALFMLFDQGFKELGPLYPLVLIYALYPSIVALYNRLGISESIRQATLSDIAIWVKTYEDQHSGTTGLDRYGWICRHLCAKIFRLGRLQFEQSIFKFPYSIYYDTSILRYRAFAQEGLVCAADGYIGVSSGSVLGSCSTTFSSVSLQVMSPVWGHFFALKGLACSYLYSLTFIG